MLTVSLAELCPMKSPITGTVITLTMAVVTLGGGIFVSAVPFAKPLLELHDESTRHKVTSAIAA
jgi:hypothetical protein